jgi:hypothetical protein
MYTSRFFLFLAIVGMITFLSIVVGNSDAIASNAENRFNLEGSWMADGVTEPGPGALPPFKALITFATGGGCVETVLLPPVTPAHGAWERVGKREFIFSVVHHILDANNNFIGTIKAKAIVTMTGKDEFDATFEGKFFAPDGTLVFPIKGAEHGTRIDTEVF